MTKLTSDRILRALARFDVATVDDVASALNRGKRQTWDRLQGLVAEGFVARDGERGRVARYAITDAGKALIASAP